MVHELEILRDAALCRYHEACGGDDYKKEKLCEELYNNLLWATSCAKEIEALNVT